MSTKRSLQRVVLFALFALGCLGLSSLGVWQLSRAAEKRARFEAFAARRAAPAVEFDALLAGEPVEDHHWRQLVLRGHYRELNILLDNRVRAGVAGYEVLTPFVTDGGRTVLVDRGWIALPGSREAVPDVLAPADPFVIQGYAAPAPATGIPLGEAGSAASEWLAPDVIRVQHVDFAALTAVVGAAPWPALVYLDDGAPAALITAWPVPGDGAARHQAYAVQWFAMAAVLALIGIWNWRRSASRHA